MAPHSLRGVVPMNRIVGAGERAGVSPVERSEAGERAGVSPGARESK